MEFPDRWEIKLCFLMWTPSCNPSKDRRAWRSSLTPDGLGPLAHYPAICACSERPTLYEIV